MKSQHSLRSAHLRLVKTAAVIVTSIMAAAGTMLCVRAEIPVGKPAPTFTLKKLDGKSLSLSQFRGKVVFLDFWMFG